MKDDAARETRPKPLWAASLAWLLVPLPFALWKLFYVYAINVDQLAFADVLIVALRYAVLALAAAGILALVLKSPPAAAIVVSLAFVLLHAQGDIARLLGRALPAEWRVGEVPAADVAALAASVALVVATMVVVAIAGRRDASWVRGTARFARTLGVALLSASLAFAGWQGIRHAASTGEPALTGSDPTTAGAVGKGASPGQRPDIYLLVFDRYMAVADLKDASGFDNSEFIRWLEGKGFFVASDARSNYTVTYLSLAALLNMRYLDDYTNVPGRAAAPDGTEEDRAPFYRLVREGTAIRELKRRGYTYVHLTSGWGATDKAPLADVLVRPGDETEFGEALASESALRFALGQGDKAGRWRFRILNTFSQLKKTTARRGPKLVFAHMLFPHPPYVFNADGSAVTVDAERAEKEDGDQHTALFLGQLRYANVLIQDLVEHIQKKNGRPAVIVLMGDHGGTYKRSTDDNSELDMMRRKTSILNAFYFPDGGEAGGTASGNGAPAGAHSAISPVNTFRLLFARYFGADLPLLKDRSFYSKTQEWPYWPPEVTDVVRGADTKD